MAAAQDVLNGVEKTVTFTSLKPQLLVEAPKAADAIQVYKSAFGAVEVSRNLNTKRKAEQELPLISSAHLQIGGFSLVISDLVNDSEATNEKSGTGAVSVLCLETEDVEAAISQAVHAGFVADGDIVEGENGGRVGKVKDPFGFTWLISSPSKTSVDVEA